MITKSAIITAALLTVRRVSVSFNTTTASKTATIYSLCR